MPHSARRKSESGYYHVVPKGIADQLLFEDDSDRSEYVELLEQAILRFRVRLHAYCLMSNHVHLVIEDLEDDLAGAMKFVHERYAMRFADKTGRRGGVFRKPYWSEPIETDSNLLCAVRYVHANPAAAGLCMASAYPWSSARDYLGRKGITYTATVLDMLGGREGFIDFSQQTELTAKPFLSSRLNGHLSDDEALYIAKCILGRPPHEIVSLDPKQRDAAVRLLGSRGFSMKRIMRMTGVGRRTAARCLRRRAPKGVSP